jgi:hypothetical protein
MHFFTLFKMRYISTHILYSNAYMSTATRFSILLIISTFGLPANAQLFVGGVAGPQLSQMRVYDVDDTIASDYYSLPGVGFHAGAFVSMQVKKRYYLTGSIEYSQKRKSVRLRGDGLYEDVVNLHYIDVPIYYSLEFTQSRGKFAGKGGKLVVYDWFLGGGPVISYWMGGKGKIGSTNIRERFDTNEQAYRLVFDQNEENLDREALNKVEKVNVKNPNRFQFSFNITGGMAFQPVGRQKIIVSASAEIAQSFLSKERDAFIAGSSVERSITRGKNHNLRVSIAYVIDTRVSERNRGKSISKDRDKVKRKR